MGNDRAVVRVKQVWVNGVFQESSQVGRHEDNVQERRRYVVLETGRRLREEMIIEREPFDKGVNAIGSIRITLQDVQVQVTSSDESTSDLGYNVRHQLMVKRVMWRV